MADVKVTNIFITIGKKELNLSVEDAKKLQEVLNNIFGNPTTVIYKDWSKPYITWSDKIYPPNEYPKITCSDDGAPLNKYMRYLGDLNTLQCKVE